MYVFNFYHQTFQNHFKSHLSKVLRVEKKLYERTILIYISRPKLYKLPFVLLCDNIMKNN